MKNVVGGIGCLRIAHQPIILSEITHKHCPREHHPYRARLTNLAISKDLSIYIYIVLLQPHPSSNLKKKASSRVNKYRNISKHHIMENDRRAVEVDNTHIVFIEECPFHFVGAVIVVLMMTRSFSFISIYWCVMDVVYSAALTFLSHSKRCIKTERQTQSTPPTAVHHLTIRNNNK